MMKKIMKSKYEDYKLVVIEAEPITVEEIAEGKENGYKYEVGMVKDGIIYFHEIEPKWY